MADTFIDPLQQVLDKYRAAAGEQPIATKSSDEQPQPIDREESTEDMYGDNDLAQDIAREDAIREQERLDRIAEMRTNVDSDVMMPPDPHDMNYHKEAIAYQGEKLEIVTRMIQNVIHKYELVGGIPEEIKMQVMGELIDIYHRTGEQISEEFEQTILKHWQTPPAANVMSDQRREQTQPVNMTDDQEQQQTSPQIPVPTININVEAGTPVTVNVDDSIVPNFTRSNEVNIHVKELTPMTLEAMTIIENSPRPNVIKPYDSGLHDVPVTLPLSGYRCVMRPINYFGFIQLTTPMSGNNSENELRKWSVIYKHMKNVSIGEFADFEDFLKKTKYQDRELLMWALLVATADEEETISFPCNNDKCGRMNTVKYHPREIVHLDPELIPEHYNRTHSVSVGDEALEHFHAVSGKRTMYRLEESDLYVEINEPSAYEFINEKLELVQNLYKRYRPNEEDMTNFDVNDPTMIEFDYLSANAMFVSAFVKIDNQTNPPTHYRYTNWDTDIERIITEDLGTEDSATLLKLIEHARSNVTPASFYIPNVVCPHCGHKENLVIGDIGNTLLLQMSRRLGSTKINLIK